MPSAPFRTASCRWRPFPAIWGFAGGDLSLQDIALDGVLDGSHVTVKRIAADTPEGGGLVGSGSLQDGALSADVYLTKLPIDPLLAAAGQEGKEPFLSI